MKNWLYKKAKAFVENHEEVEKEKERLYKENEEKRNIERNHLTQTIRIFRNAYVDNAISSFKKAIEPKFKNGDVVTFNWYDGNQRDAWFGSVSMMMSHTPYWGPKDVLVVDVVLDASQLTEFINDLHENGEFSDKYASHDLNYDIFKIIVDNKIRKISEIDQSLNPRYYGLYWSYRVKVQNDLVDHWKYPIPEKFFVPSDSEIAKLSKKCVALEVEIAKKQSEKDSLKLKLHTEMSKLTSQFTNIK